MARPCGAFFSDAQILAIAKGRLDDVLDTAEQAMLRFARQVAIDASRVTAADVAALARHGFADAEIFDIAAAVGRRAPSSPRCSTGSASRPTRRWARSTRLCVAP